MNEPTTHCEPDAAELDTKIMHALDPMLSVAVPDRGEDPDGDWEEEAPEGSAIPRPPKSVVSLAAYFEGEVEQIVPEVGMVLPGKCLFYRGAANSIHGEPAVGKTNILLAAAKAVLDEGGIVLYLDPEDTPRNISMRARMLGITAEQIHRFFYVQNPQPEDYAELHAWARKANPDMVVLDGLAEALALEALDENSPKDNLVFFRSRTRPFVDCGSAVVIADHVTKGEGNKRFSRGSGAKLGNYGGITYEVRLGEAYTPEKGGFVKLVVAKDRNGGVGAMGQHVFDLHFTPGDDGTVVEWKLPHLAEFRPTKVMEKIMRHLESFGVDTKTGIVKSVGSKAEYVAAALGILEREGRVLIESCGRSHKVRLIPEKKAEKEKTD